MSFHPQQPGGQAGSSQQSAPNSGSATNQKPTLTGVRIKQRKGQAKATAKFEPEVFRDALLAHLSSLPPAPTTEQIIAKLVLAGSTLELLKYSEQFFELLIVGGLLQPGGGYLDEEPSKHSRVSFLGCGNAPVLGGIPEEGQAGGDWKKQVRELVEVLKKVIQRYKYLQKPLEENSLPGILQYLPKWSSEAREKIAYATAFLLAEGQANGKCFQSLYKEHVVKDGVALGFLTTFFQAYLSIQTIDHLASTLRKAGFNNLLLVFPQPVRDRAHLEAHFKKENLPQIVDWYIKKITSAARDEVVTRLKEMMSSDDDSIEDIIEYLKTYQTENKVADVDVVQWVWAAIMETMDWSIKPEQIEGAAVKEIKTFAPVLEPFCNGAKVEVALINAAQVYCYAETRVMKAFPQILKVLYNADCISDQAIIYWAQKGAKPQGKQHFLKATEPLVKFLQEQEDESDDE